MRVPLLNFKRGPEIPPLNFEGDPGVPLLNLKGVPGPTFKLSGGSRVPGTGVPLLTFKEVLVPLLRHAIVCDLLLLKSSLAKHRKQNIVKSWKYLIFENGMISH